MAKELSYWDLTLSVECSTAHYMDMVARLKQVFKQWAFQRELTDSGYDHWQIRGKLFKPKSENNCVKSFGELMYKAHWSPTCKTTHNAKSFNYVMKADTRKEGPWTSADPDFEDPPVLTRQLRVFFNHVNETGMYPWQTSLKSFIQVEEDRLIRCIVETGGNNGKSIFCEFLEYLRLAYEIPPMTCMEDIMQCCMGLPAKKCYLVDMPRAMKKEKLAGFYSGLEALKNGVMYDKRYAFKKRRIDRPQIVVFTNIEPDTSLLSPDRWALYKIVDRELVPFEPTVPNQSLLMV